MAIKDKDSIIENITNLANQIRQQNTNAGWWNDLEAIKEVAKDKQLKNKLDAIFGKDFVEHYITLLKSQKLALIHSEVSEALEGLRKNLNDNHLPNVKMFDAELADVFIRTLDVISVFGKDFAKTVIDKCDYNNTRTDHHPENRCKAHGKQF